MHRLVTVIGGINIDMHFTSLAGEIAPGTSNPSRLSVTAGGVGRNIAVNLARLGCEVQMIGIVGSDDQSAWLVDGLERSGVGTAGIVRAAGSTAGTYAALLHSNGTLAAGASAMEVIERFDVDELTAGERFIRSAQSLVIDGNMPVDVVEQAIAIANESGTTTFVEPVSRAKAERLSAAGGHVFLATPSANEYEPLRRGRLRVEWTVITNGASGCTIMRNGTRIADLPAPQVDTVDETGAGDALMAGIVAGVEHEATGPDEIVAAVRRGIDLAATVVTHHGSTLEESE